MPAATAPATAPTPSTDGTPILAAAPAGAEVAHLPAAGARLGQQGRIRIDRHRPSDEREQRQVVDRVGIGRAPRQVEPLARGQRAHRVGLRLAVQHRADQVAGVDAVAGLGDGAERAGQVRARDAMIVASSTGVAVTSQTATAGVEVLLGQRVGARPDLVGHLLVVDLLAEGDDLVDLLAGDERQRALAGRSAGRAMTRRAPAAGPAARRSGPGPSRRRSARAARPFAK